MILKNLLRRKGRTLLTMAGISIGVMAIIALGALADGVTRGYDSVLQGSQADLILSDASAMDITMSSVDDSAREELLAMPEVQSASGMLQGIVQTGDQPYFFVFGYPQDSFVLSRFQVVEGVDLYSREADLQRGKPLIIGSAGAEALHKQVGDTVQLTGTTFRVVGIYETGDAFEEGGCVIRLADAQELLGLQRKVSMISIQLNQGADRERLKQRVERLWPDLSLTTTEDLSNRQIMGASFKGMALGVAGLSILIGGVGMMNAQLMAVFERTREIGVLRAVGWSRLRVMRMILAESVVVGLLGGMLGIFLAWLILSGAGAALAPYGVTDASAISPALLIEALVVVLTLGLFGGMYPAWRASTLEPVEALRYEGGSGGGNVQRLPVGGMAAQSLWRRRARTLLTVGGIAITVGAIMSLDAIVQGLTDSMNTMLGGAEIVLRQAEASDLGYAFLDQRIGDRAAALPEVKDVSGLLFTAVTFPQTGYFIIQGYSPHEAGIQRFNVVEGDYLDNNRQIMLGRRIADSLHLGVGDSITVSTSRFRIVGIFESSVGWEELGGVISLRDAQSMAERPGKVTLFMINLQNPAQAQVMVARLNALFPEVYASLGGEFADNLDEMKVTNAMLGAISVMAVAVGGIGMMNTMLMAVLERTREIGVMRALGWRRRRILGLILNEALFLGILGAVMGIVIAFAMSWLLTKVPYGEALQPLWTSGVFIRALALALSLGVIAGLYPALRATRLQPVEALRYE